MWFSHNLELVTDFTGATGAAGAGEVVARPAARTPHPTRAGGQDDGSYTNSLKLDFFTGEELSLKLRGRQTKEAVNRLLQKRIM